MLNHLFQAMIVHLIVYKWAAMEITFMDTIHQRIRVSLLLFLWPLSWGPVFLEVDVGFPCCIACHLILVGFLQAYIFSCILADF